MTSNMTPEYGSLLAQVVPVLLLALVLELRAILKASQDENRLLRESGILTRDEQRFLRIRLQAARLFDLELPETQQSLDIHANQSDEIEEDDLDDKFIYNGLSKFDAMGFLAIYGLLMLALGRTEIIALAAARGRIVANAESTAASFVILLALILLIVVPIGLEVYKMVGLMWSRVIHRLYWAAGFVALVIFILTSVGYLF